MNVLISEQNLACRRMPLNWLLQAQCVKIMSWILLSVTVIFWTLAMKLLKFLCRFFASFRMKARQCS